MQTERPRLLTFDIFGTILDWRTGLEGACRAVGRSLGPGKFDRVIDAQAVLERRPFLDYATVTQRSLVEVVGLDDRAADAIGATVGCWPLFPDAPVLRTLMAVTPCATMTNSDRRHGEDIEAALGFRLDACCAPRRSGSTSRIRASGQPWPISEASIPDLTGGTYRPTPTTILRWRTCLA